MGSFDYDKAYREQAEEKRRQIEHAEALRVLRAQRDQALIERDGFRDERDEARRVARVCAQIAQNPDEQMDERTMRWISRALAYPEEP
jgi:uncharacterized coiled-coil DUF342 family protein